MEPSFRIWTPDQVLSIKLSLVGIEEVRQHRQSQKKGGDMKVSAPNSDDAEQLRTFKARARMRQETFHGRLKRMSCLTAEFRHGKERHATCFEALCVLCCYEMELVSPLFDA